MSAHPGIESFLVSYALLLIGGITYQNMNTALMLRVGPCSWEQTVRLLKAVRSSEVRQIAARPDHECNNLDILLAVGGPEGLDRLRHNGMVLAALARHLEAFSLLYDPTVVERIETCSLTLRRKAFLARTLLALRCGTYVNMLCVRSIAITYCEMVPLLIGIYSTTHIARRERLIAACNW